MPVRFWCEIQSWKKLVYNSTFNTVCTLAGVDIGRLETFGGADTLERDYIHLWWLSHSLKEVMLRIDDGKYYKASMLIDFE